MKKHIPAIIAVVLVLFIIFLLFGKNDYKFFNSGNNMSNKSADEIKNYILNMSSFNAEVSVTITSNKTTNTYEFLQKYSR